MQIEIREEPLSSIANYAQIPVAFEVRSIFDIEERDDPSHRFVLSERVLHHPYTKDYDTLEDPAAWPTHFDVTNWALLGAYLAGTRVGAAAILCDTAEIDMTEGRRDLAVLWDIRVAPEVRGRGVGAALFKAAEDWARTRRCRDLKVETQNNNAAACKFYHRQGCVLRSIARDAYPALPNEVQMLFYKNL